MMGLLSLNAPSTLSLPTTPPPLSQPPSSLLKGQMSSMEICKSVEVYSVTRLYPLHLLLHPTIILLLSIAAKKEAKKKGEKKGVLSLLFFRAHFKICFFFLSVSFLPPKLSFWWKITP